MEEITLGNLVDELQAKVAELEGELAEKDKTIERMDDIIDNVKRAVN